MTEYGLALSVCLVAMAPALVAAQPGRFATFPGSFVNGRAALDASFRCLSLGDSLFEPDVKETESCRPDPEENLGRAASASWVTRSYRRRWLVAAADTVAETEIVLFKAIPSPRLSGSGSAKLTPVWHYRYEGDVLRSVTLQVVTTRGGTVLIGVDECVNGTGGCAQSFATYNGTGHPVATPFLDSLDRQFPGAVQHGFHVDLYTMRGEASLYSEKDPNCCPSRVAEMTLALRGNTMVLTTLRVRRAE